MAKTPTPDDKPTPRKLPTPEQIASCCFDGHAILCDVGPEYAAIQARFEQLCAREEVILAELRELTPQVEAMRFSEMQRIQRAQQRHQPIKRREHPPGALALLEDVVVIPPPEQPNPQLQPAMDRADALDEELRNVRAAVKLILPEVQKANRAASEKLADRLGPTYNALASRYLAALIDLGQITELHHEFMHSVRTSAPAAFRPLALSAGLGRPSELGAEINRILRFAVEIGHIDRSAIPAVFKVEI